MTTDTPIEEIPEEIRQIELIRRTLNINVDDWSRWLETSELAYTAMLAGDQDVDQPGPMLAMAEHFQERIEDMRGSMKEPEIMEFMNGMFGI